MPPSNWHTAWQALRDAAGLPGLRFHDLRHTVVTRLLEAGVPDHVVESINWAPLATHARALFAHSAQCEQASARPSGSIGPGRYDQEREMSDVPRASDRQMESRAAIQELAQPGETLPEDQRQIRAALVEYFSIVQAWARASEQNRT
jgi:hypothetical protein